MKRYFLVKDDESNLGVFEYSTNKEADTMIMQIVCDHYCADDCEINNGFKIENYHGKTQSVNGFYWEDAPEIHEEIGDKIPFDICIEQIGVYNVEEKEFPNGLDSWIESHYEISQAIERASNFSDNAVSSIIQKWGTGGLYDLANELTNKFERENKSVEWGIEKEYFDTMDEFLTNNL